MNDDVYALVLPSLIAVLVLFFFLTLATRLKSVAVGFISALALALVIGFLGGGESFDVCFNTVFYGLIGSVAAFVTRLFARQFRDWPFDAKKE